ncbi:hypothetical protein Gyru_ORF115 [Gynaephora ruoergensis nucleopolyhedrovirus]|nr:hypothetical protein Gyru_ORF115 [Gynaephora ruoergensis nucleopolyhedrovirus]
MQIVAYIVVVTTVHQQNEALVDFILSRYFCPLFVVHGFLNSMAVCEDSIYPEGNVTHFRNYENYLQSSYNSLSAITIQECGSCESSSDMIDEVCAIVRRNEEFGVNYFF